MRTLADINAERQALILNATKNIKDIRERFKWYTPAQLSEMSGGLISPKNFENSLKRAYRKYRKTNGRNKTNLFNDWRLTVETTQKTSTYTIKWYDEDGHEVDSTKKECYSYLARFV